MLQEHPEEVRVAKFAFQTLAANPRFARVVVLRFEQSGCACMLVLKS